MRQRIMIYHNGGDNLQKKVQGGEFGVDLPNGCYLGEETLWRIEKTLWVMSICCRDV
ncbi:MAG: hypothetical protein DDT34_01859 [Firmicutes bacterium]|nr:hypothetical protein [Bacillota bacterium]MBT9153006.1 hypothetical protein [Bacillota bacterium]